LTATPIIFNLAFTIPIFLLSLVLIILISNKLSKRNRLQQKES
jgi:hypothetical protein